MHIHLHVGAFVMVGTATEGAITFHKSTHDPCHVRVLAMFLGCTLGAALPTANGSPPQILELLLSHIVAFASGADQCTARRQPC